MSEEISLAGFLTKEKPCRALIHIHEEGETYTFEISRNIDSTNAHTVKTVGRLESLGLVRSEKRGRKKMLKLTEDGKRVAEAVDNLTGVIDDVGRSEQEGILE
jgi:DNA-binding MarR family transcriptional regulator